MGETLYSSQQEALEKMHNGCILVGGTGSGKSRTGLAYMFTKELQGELDPYKPPKESKDLYIITTAKKRDSHEWEEELLPFKLSTDPNLSINHIRVIIDSWNNIKKYKGVYGALFLFDEQKVCGKGAWVKSFLKISQRNRWVLLSATPCDTYEDLVPVLIANHYYKNRTEFNMCHVVYKPYLNYPVIDHYVNTGKINRARNDIMVYMKSEREIPKKTFKVSCEYDKELYKKVWKDRWDPFENCPIEETGKLFYLMRRVVNGDKSRVEKLKEILEAHPKAIIFYNFQYEHEIIKENCKAWGYVVQGWNGNEHDPLPTGDKWVYLCQYTAASEGWNAITTDTIIFYSLNYSYKQMRQAAGRTSRLNTPYKLLYYFELQSYAPIDLAIRKALSQKRDFNERAYLGI